MYKYINIYKYIYKYKYIYIYKYIYKYMNMREACKESSDETESIAIIFSAEINLLWRLNQIVLYIYIYYKMNKWHISMYK